MLTYCDMCYKRSEYRICGSPEKGPLTYLGVKKGKRSQGKGGSESCRAKRNELGKRRSGRQGMPSQEK